MTVLTLRCRGWSRSTAPSRTCCGRC